MSEEITIEIQESPPVNITLDDGCEVQVSIDGSVSSVYWQDVLNKPDFDTLYYPRTNPSGYVTGSVVRPSETGVFYLASNPSGFISGAVVRPDTYILRDSNSLQSINWQTRVLAFEGLYSIGWGDRYLYDGTETPVLDWNSRSLLGVWSSDSDPVSGNDLVRLSYLSGGYYPLSNPSGFVTGIDSSIFVLKSESGAFYPRSNPSGFITGFNSGAYVTGQVVRPSETGDFISRFQTGQFYASNNPSGFITGINSGNFVLKSDTGVYTGLFYPLTQNPSGYITGSVVRPSETGGFINTSQTGQFYSAANPSGFITGVNTGNFVLKSETGSFVLNSQTGQLTGSFYPLSGNPQGYVTGQVVRPSDTGAFYPSSNPSGFITGVDTSSFVLQSQTGAYTGLFYPLNQNPNGYVTGSVVRPSETGAFITSSQTGQFYPMSNPSGFATGIDSSNFVLKSETGAYTGQFYPRTTNPSGYVTGSVIRPSDTGSFITTSQTGAFYPRSNPSGFVSDNSTVVRTNVVQTITYPKEFAGGIQDALGTVVLSPNTQTLINAAGFATVDWNAGVLTRNDTTTSVNWENSTAYDAASNPSVYWSDRVLADSSNLQSVNWDGRILLDSAANYSIDFGTRILYSSSGQETVSWDANTLKYLGAVAIDWSGRILNAGAWTHNFTPSSDEHIVNLGYLTGYSYPRSSNPSGYVTGSVIRPSDTGNFTTSSQTGSLTGSFYPLLSNPSGYVTGSVIRPSDTGVFVSQSQTGSLTGAFYPLSSNPSSYVTGLVVRPSETGAFATTGWVDENYYPRSNPSGYSAGGGGLTQQQTMAIASLGF